MRRKSQKDWFVLCTKVRQELKVLERLNQLGIETYTPTKIVVKRWSDRKKNIKTCYWDLAWACCGPDPCCRLLLKAG